MTEIRCPNCNKKTAESPDNNLVFITICVRCSCRFKYDYGTYSHEPPTDFAKRMKYDKYSNVSYQDRMRLNKK